MRVCGESLCTRPLVVKRIKAVLIALRRNPFPLLNQLCLDEPSMDPEGAESLQ